MSLQNIKAEAGRWAVRPKAGLPTIGLVNLMPDAAFAATEAQFHGLLTAASGEPGLHLELFTLPELTRKGAVLADARRRYRSAHDLSGGWLDGIIVTGTEPKQADLRSEAYWPGLARIVDWAAGNTRSAVFSCLAAHAAVLHLDGISRRKMSRKLTGLMVCNKTAPHWATDGLPDQWLTPHSRWNDLSESELARHGYQLTSHAQGAGADQFVKSVGSQFVFMQGHPEYAGDALLKEYRRDVRRFLAGETESYPQVPLNLFDAPLAAEFEVVAASARHTRDPELLKTVSHLLSAAPNTASWRGQAVQFYRNWLGVLGAKTRAELVMGL